MKSSKNNRIFWLYLIILTTVYLFLEFYIDTSSGYASSQALKITLLLLFLLLLIAIRAASLGIKKLFYSCLSEEEKTTFIKYHDRVKFSWRTIFKQLTLAKPINEEADILLDHDYDGIKELDNRLPPWWLYLFYLTILFGFSYLFYFHFLGGPSQTLQYIEEMKLAQEEIEAYKETQKVKQLGTTATIVTKDVGAKLFKRNCAVCHAVDGGGGIGPNLTDAYWILGGGIENIANTIRKGGRPGKGMVSWQNSLSDDKIMSIANFVWSLQGKHVEKPKQAQGELWETADKQVQ